MNSNYVKTFLVLVTFCLFSFLLGASYQQKFDNTNSKTGAPNVRVTEQYTRGQRVTSGKTTAWSTGDGSNWSMVYQSDGIFIDCRN